MRREKRKHNVEKIRETLEKGKSLRHIRNADKLGKDQMIEIKNRNGKTVKNRGEIVKATGEFYEDLYTSKIRVPQNNIKTDTSDILDITEQEVTSTLRGMKLGRAPGEDGITTDLLESRGNVLHKGIAQLFTQCLKERKIPENLCKGIVILLHKKEPKKS